MPKPKRRWIKHALETGKPGTVEEWEAHDLGVEHSQYFQGCGTSFTRWDDVASGIGNTPLEAFNDALEMLAQGGWDVNFIPERPRGLSSRSQLPKDMDEESELHHFVCVYVRGIQPEV